MHEHHKIDEAEYFLTRMALCEEDPREFTFNLSAFLSSARSALQYALDEASLKPGGRAWYDSCVGASKEVKFLKDKRDLSIHVAPVVPTRHISIEAIAHVSVGCAVEVVIRRADGTTEDEFRSESPPAPAPALPTSVTVSYHLNDWPGHEDLVTVCLNYLTAVRAIVADGYSRGFLT